MGTQKAIAEAVVRGRADYVLALKRNHETLHRDVVDFIDEQLEGKLEEAQELTTTERGHGREDERTYLQLPVPKGLPGRNEWKGLKSVGLVTSRRVKNGEESIEIRYYLSSLAVDVELFARAVRGHWSVENACHWSLDVTFREDDSRVRERVLGSNITWLYRFTLSILKQHPDRRQSLIMKRRGCGWSDTLRRYRGRLVWTSGRSRSEAEASSTCGVRPIGAASAKGSSGAVEAAEILQLLERGVGPLADHRRQPPPGVGVERRQRGAAAVGLVPGRRSCGGAATAGR